MHRRTGAIEISVLLQAIKHPAVSHMKIMKWKF